MTNPSRSALPALLIATVLAVGCSDSAPPPPEPSAAATPDASTVLRGDLGHFDRATSFLEALTANDMRIVRFDLRIAEADFDGSVEDGFFVLWEDCEPLAADERPNSMKCSGWNINIEPTAEPKDGGLFAQRGDYFLRGPFAVVGCDGPSQGMIGCTLRPLNIEEAG